LFGTVSGLSHLRSDNKKAETNLIPLGTAAIHRIVERIEPFPFGQIYGVWWKANVLVDAKNAVARSAERYLRGIGQCSCGESNFARPIPWKSLVQLHRGLLPEKSNRLRSES
jgi:hypothetical protein